MERGSVSFIATGDSFITRRLPQVKKVEHEKLARFIQTADVRFTNFEVTTPGHHSSPSAFSGGTWAYADDNVIDDLKWYGFNCVNLATNHTLDYLYDGLKQTQVSLEERGLVYAGAGATLAEASSPVYIETKSGRAALIGTTSTFHDSWMAGHQRRDCIGRAGVNGLRYETIHYTTANHLETLKEIAERTGINAQRNLDEKEGFAVKGNKRFVHFGNYQFAEADESKSVRIAKNDDVSRIIRTIKDAKRQADYVLVSYHSHEMEGESKDKPADFMMATSRAFIDAGADAIIGHGPHILRGIELYKGKPIFYSLGNFIFQNDTVEKLPADFYEKYGLTDDHTVADALDKRSRGGKIGLGTNKQVWESVIAEWKMNDGKLTELILHPIEMGFGQERYERGWPEMSDCSGIIEHIQNLSAPYGTEIKNVNGKGVVTIA